MYVPLESSFQTPKNKSHFDFFLGASKATEIKFEVNIGEGRGLGRKESEDLNMFDIGYGFIVYNLKEG